MASKADHVCDLAITYVMCVLAGGAVPRTGCRTGGLSIRRGRPAEAREYRRQPMPRA